MIRRNFFDFQGSKTTYFFEDYCYIIENYYQIGNPFILRLDSLEHSLLLIKLKRLIIRRILFNRKKDIVLTVDLSLPTTLFQLCNCAIVCCPYSKPVFLNLFLFTAPLLGYRVIWQHSYLQLTSKQTLSSEIGITLKALQCNQGCRGTRLRTTALSLCTCMHYAIDTMKCKRLHLQYKIYKNIKNKYKKVETNKK